MMISELSRKKKESRSVWHYNKNTGKIQQIILPFEPRNKFQSKNIKRCLADVKIIVEWDNGKFTEMNPATLIPVEKGGDVYIVYWGKRYLYKLPAWSKFLTI